MGLTPKQQAVLSYIGQYASDNGFPPTREEIRQEFGFRSPNAVTKHLRALERKGAVRLLGTARGIIPNRATGPDPGTCAIPVYSYVSAGWPESANAECVDGRLDLGRGVSERWRQGGLFALRVRGDSMIGAGILDGDVVIVEHRQPAAGDVVVALVDGESTLKRLWKKGNAFVLKAENPDIPDILPRQSLTVQGVVTSVIRGALVQ